MTKPTTIRLDDALKKRIDRLAKKLEQSAHSLMVQGIERAVADAEERLELTREADRRSAEFDRTRMAISHDEMMGWLKKKVRGKASPTPKARRLGP
jgi:predicted transcriptional regulator